MTTPRRNINTAMQMRHTKTKEGNINIPKIQRAGAVKVVTTIITNTIKLQIIKNPQLSLIRNMVTTNSIYATLISRK
jgi:hypothetical protein